MTDDRAFKFKKSLLDNGMVLVTERIPYFRSLSIGVWVAAGTRHETLSQAGLSHFLEHMMFKGTEKRTALDIAEAIDRVGGEFNAFTAREYTCFHLLLLAQDLKLATEIMSDVLVNSRFHIDDIERERKVILQEISMIEDNPEELIHDFFFEHAYPHHPLGKPILGNPKTIASFDRSAVVSFFKRHYSPKRMIISAAGDFDHNKLKQLLNQHLCNHKLSSIRANKITKRFPNVHSGYRLLKRDFEQSHVIVGFPGITYTHPKRFAAFLLNNYLGGGMSSSLFQEIREKRGLAYNIYSSLAPFSDTGLFSVYVATSPNEVGVCLDVMGREIEKLRSNPLEQKTVNILKENLKSTILLSSDSVENRMTLIAKSELFFKRYFSTSEICTLIDRVTSKDILSLARKLFNPKSLILILMGPQPQKNIKAKLLKHLR